MTEPGSGFEEMYAETAGMFTVFAELEGRDLPLYGGLCRGAAADPQMMALMQEAPMGQRRPVLLLAAVHDLLLAGASHPLAAWYSTVPDGPGPGEALPSGDPYPLFVDFVARHRDEIIDTLTHRTTQTNEVNRSCMWFAAARDATADAPDRPIGLVEVGPSAGLNLGFDRYAYDFGDGIRRGEVTSPVELRCEVLAGAPPLDRELPPVAARVGLDVAPIDPTDEREVRWLEACIWPEQPERFGRFAAAVRLTALDPPEIVVGDAVDELATAVGCVPDDAHVLVYHSWVLTYLERSRRAEFEAALDELGRQRDLTWISAEHPGCMASVPIPDSLPPDVTPTTLARRRWRAGRPIDDQPVILAIAQPHAAWLDWRFRP
jgi:hypothetical protein